MSRFQHIKLAFKTCTGFYDFFFHLGYQQVVLPRWFRKAVARSEVHKAWLSGSTGAWLGGILEREAEWQRQDHYEQFDQKGIAQ